MKFLVSYTTTGQVIIEAETEEAAKAAVEKAVLEQCVTSKIMSYATNLDDIPEVTA